MKNAFDVNIWARQMRVHAVGLYMGEISRIVSACSCFRFEEIKVDKQIYNLNGNLNLKGKMCRISISVRI